MSNHRSPASFQIVRDRIVIVSALPSARCIVNGTSKAHAARAISRSDEVNLRSPNSALPQSLKSDSRSWRTFAGEIGDFREVSPKDQYLVGINELQELFHIARAIRLEQLIDR